MKILYIANARIPTEKAHGLTIAKSCEAFAQSDAEVTLVVPRRATHIAGDVFSAYDVKPVFNVRRLCTIDAFRWSDGRLAFFIQLATFYVSVFVFMLFHSRSEIVYTREAPLCALAFLGFSVFYECHHLPKRKVIFFWLARRARGIIVISHALERAFLGVEFSPERILVAPSGVDLAIFEKRVPQEDARHTLDLSPRVPIAVYTGNFTTFGEDKGISDIITALSYVLDVTFFAIGGSDADITRYAKEAQSLEVSDRVILRGRAPQATLALAQQAADILLMPFPDTPHYRHHMSPVKMFEYMASGRPIIASDLPTIREVLDDSTAMIVPPGDPSAIAEAIKKLQADHTLASHLAAHAHTKVSKHYTWNKRADTIISFIKN